MQYGSNKGVYLATHSFTFEDCKFLSNIVKEKYNLKCTVVKTGHTGQWRIKDRNKNAKTNIEIIDLSCLVLTAFDNKTQILKINMWFLDDSNVEHTLIKSTLYLLS